MTLKTAIKKAGLSLAPQLTLQILSYRSQSLIMRLERETGRVRTSKDFCAKNGATVQSGPFKGMRYPEFTRQSRNLIPKFVGSYEDELHVWIEEAASTGYDQIINIGCADGYYAVGLALRCPHTRIIAFDTDRWARKATELLAKENGAANVVVKSTCTLEWLKDNVAANSLLLMDCEGYEADLLDVARVPELTVSDVLVELHEEQSPDIAERLLSRFGGTHRIRSVHAEAKEPGRYAGLQSVPDQMRALVISEGRHGPQQWLYMTRGR